MIKRCFCISVLVVVLLIQGVIAVRINEIELNPSGTDAGNEWIELYSEEEIDLEGYKIVNNDDGEIILNVTFSGYFIYLLEKQWLDNSDEKVFLYKDRELIDETEIFKDDKNNDLTYQFCDNKWIFKEKTKGEKNDCPNLPPVEEVIQNDTEEIIEDEEKEVIEEEPEKEKKESVQEDKKVIKQLTNKNAEIKEKPLEVIHLNPQTIKSQENNEKQENSNKNKYAMYGFVAFSILLGILFLLKSKKYNKNEFIQ